MRRSATQPSSGGRPAAEQPGVAAVIAAGDDLRLALPCLATVRAQVPAFTEVVVVAPVGTDSTLLAGQPGVRLVRIDAPGTCAAWDAGLLVTQAPVLVFLEPTDRLQPGHLAQLLPAMANPDVALSGQAVVRPASEPVDDAWGYWRLSRENTIGRGCLVRREAITQAGGWSPGLLAGRLADWHLWLRITRSGWAASPADSLPAAAPRPAPPTADEAAMVLQGACHLAVVTPFCGRGWALPVTIRTWQALDWDRRRLHLLAVDNSNDADFGDRLRREVATACRDWASVTIVNDPGCLATTCPNAAAADEATLRQPHRSGLGQTMSRLYADQAAMLLGRKIDLVLTLEDDIEIVTPQPLSRLLSAMSPATMAVAAVVRFRVAAEACLAPPVIAFRCVREHPYEQQTVADEPERTDVTTVDASHFACTLHRTESWQRLLARRSSVNGDGRCCWHDVAQGANVRRAGYQWRLHWGVRTRHWDDGGRHAV